MNIHKKLMLAAALCVVSATASAATVKIGHIAPFSGPFSEYGQEFKRGIELYLDEIGGKVTTVTIFR
ncbi:MAG TPA: hypothetical protein VKZ66_08715 [Pusillimonas sp.]|uniref:ABC transporter substrate-binding protein n=1 Tax=Pusillimonas sp. TaxID=3040095 RepID=UPI002B4B2850|nr:hypothetical protein [Pusillimonas sp.]HLU20026.1 hypothetical protein [Pusillimonas sp.]